MRLITFLVAVGLATPSFAYLHPDKPEPIAAKERSLAAPDPALLRIAELDASRAAMMSRTAESLGASVQSSRLDSYGGRIATLWSRQPLLPGAGNSLRWADVPGVAGAPGTERLGDLAWERLSVLLTEHAALLGIDPAELRPRTGVLSGGQVIQIHARREVDGVPVRGAGLTATVNHGNLVLLGLDQWGTVEVSRQPTVSAPQAHRALLAYLGAGQDHPLRAPARLELIPVEASGIHEIGEGYRHHLAWVLPLQVAGAVGRYEGAVDAHTGEVLELRDTNRYGGPRNVHGGVYPISNDGLTPDGNEEPGWPMPFVDVTHPGGTATTDAGGNLFGVAGSITTELSGTYVHIIDGCGTISETAASGDLDLGVSGGTDCDTPPGASAGNTHAARTGYYELNRIIEGARGQLPGNGWVNGQVTNSVNQFVWCNATWSGGQINFFRSQGSCANLGELAGVIDHEWGHGMDDHGTNTSVSSPGEGIADVYAALRINSSCPGRGAIPNTCGGYGDPCIPAFGCTAARDIDWARHQSMTPHDVAWASGTCGGSPHCRGMLTSESIWDLYTRDLPAQYGYDSNTALEIATRLTYLGADNVATGYSLSNGNQGGCSASHGYQQFLAADDDNGDLSDGTPHMQAIFDAFDRHDIACAAPVVQDSGCSGRPAVAPVVTGSPEPQGAELSWSPIAGATRYKILRTDGVHGCDLGKAIVGETTGTTFTDSGLQDGREYYYVVAGFTAADTCMGPTSACTTVLPAATAAIFADGFESGDTLLWSSSVP